MGSVQWLKWQFVAGGSRRGAEGAENERDTIGIEGLGYGKGVPLPIRLGEHRALP